MRLILHFTFRQVTVKGTLFQGGINVPMFISGKEVSRTGVDDGNNDDWAIRNSRYKLILNANGDEEMYDLINAPYEQNNLLNGILTSDETNEKLELEAEVLEIKKEN